MAHITQDRIQETSTSTGTGDVVLDGASGASFKTFASRLANGDTCHYLILGLTSGVPSGEWEVGKGTYNSGTDALARTTVFSSSNADALVSLSSGDKLVSLIVAAPSTATARADWRAALQSSIPQVQSVASSATVTPTFLDDAVHITAQAAGLTLGNPTGTAVDGWGWSIRIKDNGTSRSIAFDTQYRALGVTLPTATVISKTLYLGCVWNAADTKVDVVAVGQEA